MTTQQQLAVAAIESSFKSDVGQLFTHLVTALATAGTSTQAVDQAVAAFRRGYDQSSTAFAKAAEVIGVGLEELEKRPRG
jgi:hypothetical protein